MLLLAETSTLLRALLIRQNFAALIDVDFASKLAHSCCGRSDIAMTSAKVRPQFTLIA
jgi:hypothetical protein